MCELTVLNHYIITWYVISVGEEGIEGVPAEPLDAVRSNLLGLTCGQQCFYNHMYHKPNQIDTEGHRSLLSGANCIEGVPVDLLGGARPTGVPQSQYTPTPGG